MAKKSRTGLGIALLLALAAAFGWPPFQSHATTAPAAATTTSDAPAKATSAPPPVPRAWTLGKLTLKSCELKARTSGASTAAWCDDFDVAENRADPAGRHIKLKVAVIRSDAGDFADPDIVVLLAGGPGEAATQSFQNTGWYADILKHHHVLLVDQRGTGSSNPLSCPAATKAAEDAAKKVPDAAADANFDPATIRKNVAACLAEVQKKADPRFYTTTDAVADLEAVRQALGAPKFDLVGVSYGTRMAQQYLMRHPDGVRSVVLDSPVPNQLTLGADFAKNLRSALTQQFAACTATPACKKRFGDPMQTLLQLRDALAANPHEVSFRDPESFHETKEMLSASSLAMVVRMFAYSPETAALLPLTIDAAAHGDVGPLLGQAKLLTGDLSGDMNGGMSMSVVCSEDADELQPDPADAATLLGNHLVDAIKAQCSVWPHGSRPADFHRPLKSDKPILILSGALDPVTPPAYGDAIMRGLSNARHLVAKGQGHALFARGCTPRLIGNFITKLDPKGLDAGCLERLGPTPAFIDFNGAAP